METRSMDSRSFAPSLPTGREVLVVEDETRIRGMLAEALKQMGFHATLVATAEAANRALAQRTYDILILDLNLPGIGGIEFLASIRPQHPDIQVIILTGFGDLESAQKAIHLDVVEFLTKPCALGTLERALDRARKRLKNHIVGEFELREPLMQFETAPTPATITMPSHETDGGRGAGKDAEPVSMDDVEQRHILEVLQKNNGNRAAAANELGISLRKLYYRLNDYQRKGVAIP